MLDPSDWSFQGSFFANSLLNLASVNALNAINNPYGTDSSGDFTVTTVNGAISAWDFALQVDEGRAGEYQLKEEITSQGDSYYERICSDQGCTFQSGSNNRAGRITKAPEIDPASAASALTLLFGGIAVVRGRRARS